MLHFLIIKYLYLDKFCIELVGSQFGKVDKLNSITVNTMLCRIHSLLTILFRCSI